MTIPDPTRANRLTASCFPIIMGGDEDKLQRLFLEKNGDPRFVLDGVSESWTARFGMVVEPFAPHFYAQKTGCTFSKRGEQFFHPDRPYVSCTLDAYRASDDRVMDVKTMNAYDEIDEKVAYSTPQLIGQMECKGAQNGSILVVKGGNEPIECPIYFDEPYLDLMWKTIDRFWECIETLTPPFPLHFPRVVPPERWRKIDLDHDEEQPNWAEDMRQLLGNWSATEADAKAHDATKVEIKKILPDDCGRLVWSGLVIARAGNNAVSIKRAKERN